MGHAPWSVKGIDPKARAKAREHAQRDGITLGSYLNRLLLEDSGSNDGEKSHSPLNSILRGEAPPERVSEVASTLEEISRRMNAGENRSTQALAGVDQSMLTLLNRLESTERATAGMASRFDGALDDMRATHASLEERLDSVSRKDNSRRMLDAMRALEGALTKLSKQVHDTKDKVATEHDNLREEVNRGVSHLSKEVDNITRRVDESTRRFDDTSSRLDRFERTADDRLRDALGRTETALDVARAQSRKAEERFNSLEDKVSETQRKADSALATSQNSFNDLRESLKSFASHTDSKLDEAISTADTALSTAQRNSSEISAEVTKRNNELAEKLFGSINDVEQRIAAAQQNVTSMFAKVSDVGAKAEKAERSGKSSEEALATLQAAMERINERVSAAEENKANAITDLEKSYSTLDERLDEVQQKIGDSTNIREEFEAKLASIADDFSKSLEDTRTEMAQISSQSAAGNEGGNAIEALQQQMDAVHSEIAAAEERQLNAVELITGQFERLSEALDQRLHAVETNKSTNVGVLAEQVGKIAGHMEERLEATNKKIDDTERRSAEAIEQVGEHVARATERLQARNEETFDNIYEKIDEVSKSTRQHLSSTMEDIEKRLRDAREEAERIVSPVQNTVSSLAKRINNMSSGGNDDIDFEDDFSSDIAPPPLPSADLEDDQTNHFSNDSGILDDFIDAVEMPETDASSTIDDFEENTTSPPVFEDEYTSSSASEGGIKDDEIADIAYNARKEFAAELAEQRAELEAEEELFRQNDDAVEEFAINSQSAFPISEDENLFSGDAETDAFTSSLELEYETELPVDSPAYHMRSDEGLNDDPYARASNNSSEFLNSARQAAKERGTTNRAIVTGNDERKNNKLPMVAAGVLAAAVVGGAGMVAMRGKHVNADDAFTTTPPKFNPDSIQSGSTLEDEDTLFDSNEEAADTQAALEREQNMEFANLNVDEELLFPQEARILTSDNFKKAEATSGALNSASVAPAKRVSPLDAFASSRTKDIAEASATSATPAAATSKALPETLTSKPKTVTLETAAASGSPIALHELAIKQLASGEKRIAAETMRKAADQGLAAAQYRMGKLYERGEGVPRSIKESRKWTKLAAENGNVKAMHDLAVFYAEGEGGEQSFLSGVEWFSRAAEYGLIDSQYNLGVLYEQGLGVSTDLAKAAYWFEVAGHNGDADGTRRAREILRNLPSTEANKIIADADAFIPRQMSAAANGKFGPQSWNAPMKAQIAEVQSLLSKINGIQLTNDGIMGPNTRNAIRSWEERNGLIPTGDVSDALLRQLRAATQKAA